jgi:hypothetical protein
VASFAKPVTAVMNAALARAAIASVSTVMYVFWTQPA